MQFRVREFVTAQVSQAGFNPAEAWRSGAGGLWSTLREGPNLASWLWRGASGSLRNRRRLAGAEATRDLLPQLHHAPVAFGLVVGEWNTRIMKEAQHIVFPPIRKPVSSMCLTGAA